jgi:hypothetical protein
LAVKESVVKKMMQTLIAMLATLTLGATVQAQTLASTMQVYVFPKQGQDAAQQSKDEASCYDWAVSNTGSDPFELADQTAVNQQQAQADQQAAKQAGAGAGAKGAVGGAAAGALIGEIVDDDAGKGAAYGAAAGVIHGRRTAKKSQAQAQQQAAASASQREQATADQLTNFKNAFSVCLEAKDYMVKG